MIWRNIFSVRVNSLFFHSVVAWKNEKFYLTKKNLSNQLFSKCFGETTNAFTKFLRKKCEREFLQFSHCGILVPTLHALTKCVEKRKNLFRSHKQNISWNQRLSRNVTFTKCLIEENANMYEEGLKTRSSQF